jgi:hypothetical protein
MWLLGVWKVIKPLAPYILAVVAVAFAYTYIYNKGKHDGIVKGYNNAIEETRKLIESIPPCECPPTTEVSLQTFDLSKLNNKRGNFTYAPSLNNVTVVIRPERDSTLLKELSNQLK